MWLVRDMTLQEKIAAKKRAEEYGLGLAGENNENDNDEHNAA